MESFQEPTGWFGLGPGFDFFLGFLLMGLGILAGGFAMMRTRKKIAQSLKELCDVVQQKIPEVPDEFKK